MDNILWSPIMIVRLKLEPDVASVRELHTDVMVNPCGAALHAPVKLLNAIIA